MLSTSAPRIRAAVWIAAAASLLFFSIGCASGSAYRPPVPPVGSTGLGPGMGYLLVHVRTDIPLHSVTTTAGQVAARIPRGETAWLVELPAGTHDWRRVQPAESTGTKKAIRLIEYRQLRRFDDWVWDDEYTFDVVAGQVNYPGTLVVESDPSARSESLCCWVRVRNQSATAVRAVLDEYGALLEGFPLRHGGAGKDGFLRHYSEVRDRLYGHRAKDAEGAE